MTHMVGTRSKKISTVKIYISRVELFQKRYPDLDTVTRDDIAQYLTDMKIKHLKNDNTRRLSQTALISFFTWYSSKMGIKNPAVNLQPIKAYFSHPKLIHPHEIQRMIYAMEQRNDDWGRRTCAVIVLLAETGIRIQEFEKLKFGNVRVEDKHFELIVPATKTNHERIVPFGAFLSGSLIELFGKYYLWLLTQKNIKSKDPMFFQIESKRFNIQEDKSVSLTRGAVNYLLRKAAYEAGIDRVITPHNFRHFYGTWTYKNNKDILLLAQLMGHADIKSTQKYVHLANMVSGDSLRKPATAGLKASAFNTGYIELLGDIVKNINK